MKFVTISAWPASHAPTASYNRASAWKFRTTLAKTITDLDDELDRIGARDAFVEVDVPAARIKRDGGLYAETPFGSPGVVLRFISKNGTPVVMPCDTYDRAAGNLRGIVLTLAALRDVARHGVTQSDEQYRGFTAIPAQTGTFTPGQAWDILHRACGLAHVPELPPLRALALSDAHAKTVRDNASNLVRRAQRHTHPDTGGTGADFARVTEAARILSAYLGLVND